MKHVIVGTAGHIDHGKTELVKALTGIDADRLKEEKERGITIDIGFASLTIDQTMFGFVDVPGHERFVKNMLAGAHGIDMVLLVVAADESIMPQTREHFDICRLLKVKSGLVAITKTDLVEEEMIELVEEEVREFIAGSFLEDARLVRVSARTKAGLDDLRAALSTLGRQVREKRTDALPRLPIDRVFSKKGFGTVVTGTLIAGTLSEGQSVEILPRHLATQIRGVQVHNNPVPMAHAGERTAVNLQGLGRHQIGRGDVMVPAKRFHPTSMLDARLELLPSSPQPIRNRHRVRFHLGTAEILARVILLDCDLLQPGESALVQFRLEGPTFALPDDCFIIRRYSPQITIGGGVVLDALAPKHTPFRPESTQSLQTIERLRKLETEDTPGRLETWIDAAGHHCITAADLIARSGLTPEGLNQILSSLIRRGRLVEVLSNPRSFLTAQNYQELKLRMRELLATFHRLNPLLEGMSREELRTRLLPGTNNHLSAALVGRLTQDVEFQAEKDWVRLATHQVTLSPHAAKVQEQLLSAIKEDGFKARTLTQLAESLHVDLELARKLLQLLLAQGQVIRLGDMLFHAELIHNLMERVRAQKAANQDLDVAGFKEITGVTRKYAIPLLEYLDRQGVTRRVGSKRVIL